MRRADADLLVHMESNHARFVEERGTSTVVLDKALYGCVETAALWHAGLCATTRGDECVPNRV